MNGRHGKAIYFGHDSGSRGWYIRRNWSRHRQLGREVQHEGWSSVHRSALRGPACSGQTKGKENNFKPLIIHYIISKYIRFVHSYSLIC